MSVKEAARAALLRFLLHFPPRLLPYLPRTPVGDRLFALVLFARSHHRLPRRSGGTLNDALFHVKASNRVSDPLRVRVTDKERVKGYVREKLGEEFNVPTIAVLRSPDDARRFDYPDRCVIKPTHLSGRIILRRKGEPIDFMTISRWFKTNHYDIGREANYRYLEPNVLVEPFVFGQDAPDDYKFFCVGGRPVLIQVDMDRHIDHLRNYYTSQWELLPFTVGYPMGPGRPRPPNLAAMLEVAAKLSADFDLVRVDLYSDGNRVLLGELTHCPGNAGERFYPSSGEEIAKQLLFGERGFSARAGI